MSKKKDYLYKVNTVIDPEEFYKFQSFYMNKYKNGNILKIILILLALSLWGIEFYKGDAFLVILTTFFILIYPIIVKIGTDKEINKLYKNSLRMREEKETIYFYKDHLVDKSNLSDYNIKYKDILCTCETKDNIYIFFEDNKAFILIKNMIDKEEELKELLKKETKYKRYRR